MNTFIGYQSAVYYWKSRASLLRCAYLTRDGLDERCAASLRELADVPEHSFASPGDPLHLLVPNAHARRRSSRHVTHLTSGTLPKRSFYRVSPGVYVASPELAFVQAASFLSLIELVQLGCEFCGTFSVLADGTGAYTRRLPLTNTTRLLAFTSQMAGQRNAQRAKNALSWVLDGAASPMEAALTLLLCLPSRAGGYGFAQPLLHMRLSTDGRLRSLDDTPQPTVGLYWPRARVDVEYHDTIVADVDAVISAGSRTSNALVHQGVRVIHVGREQLLDAMRLDAVARQLARALNRRLGASSAKTADARTELRSKLLGAW